MTIINSLLPGVARNNETSQKSQIPSQKNSIDPNKIYEEISTQEEDVLIDFSKRSKEAFSILDYMDDLPDIREDKVTELRKQIEEGTYMFDYDLTAENMVNEFMNAKI